MLNLFTISANDIATTTGYISTLVSDFWPLFALIGGIIIGFFIIEALMAFISPYNKIDDNNNDDDFDDNV